MKTPSAIGGHQTIRSSNLAPAPSQGTGSISRVRRAPDRFERQLKQNYQKSHQAELGAFLSPPGAFEGALSSLELSGALENALGLLESGGEDDSANRYAVQVIGTHLHNIKELERRMTAMLRT